MDREPLPSDEQSAPVVLPKPCADFNDEECQEVLLPLLVKHQVLSATKGISQRQLWALVAEDLAKTLDLSKFRLPMGETLRINFAHFRSKIAKKYAKFLLPYSDPPVENTDIANPFHCKIVNMLREMKTGDSEQTKEEVIFNSGERSDSIRADLSKRVEDGAGKKRVRLSEVEDDDDDDGDFGDCQLFSDSSHHRILPDNDLDTMLNTLHNARSARVEGRSVRRTRAVADRTQEGTEQLEALLKLELKIQEAHNLGRHYELQLQMARKKNLELELQVKTVDLEVQKTTAENLKHHHQLLKQQQGSSEESVGTHEM
ncbi:hypothetical protein EON65_27295 [archaeon]|nr:MAG: hypothetical protein EON65_27295 [archaeon]